MVKSILKLVIYGYYCHTNFGIYNLQEGVVSTL